MLECVSQIPAMHRARHTTDIGLAFQLRLNIPVEKKIVTVDYSIAVRYFTDVESKHGLRNSRAYQMAQKWRKRIRRVCYQMLWIVEHEIQPDDCEKIVCLPDRVLLPKFCLLSRLFWRSPPHISFVGRTKGSCRNSRKWFFIAPFEVNRIKVILNL